MGQPRRNENRFYRYPMRRVSAIIDDDAGLQAALDALPQTGVDVSKVHVLTGRWEPAYWTAAAPVTGYRHGCCGWLSGVRTRETRWRPTSGR
jgi:hypothetical protein